MLSRIQITNYRGFQSYRMEGLAQVNLLVGRNNSGKTALLEAMHLLASGGDPGVLATIAEGRGELLMPRTKGDRLVDIAHFFHGHALAVDAFFSVEGSDDLPAITVKVNLEDSGQIMDRPVGNHPLPASASAILSICVDSRPERTTMIFPITREGGVDLDSLSSQRRTVAVTRRSDGSPTRFIGTENPKTSEQASIWDEITLNSLEGEVLDALKVLQPDVTSIHHLSGGFMYGIPGRGAHFVVGLKDQKIRIPLGSMGDGMKRMLSLATSLACVGHGTLFVDEIDTGLHYSAMANMWKLVLTKAIASNIQVFATTHSLDCVRGLGIVCDSHPDLREKVAVHKIERGFEQSVAYTGADVINAAELDIEIR